MRSSTAGPNLDQINLNLMLALDALLDEGSVSAAARRLGVSQPAMSQTLRQLRELFDDPLLVRSGGKMVATPKAELLALPLRRGLVELQRVLEGDLRFDPARSERRFSLAMSDFAVWLLPRTLELLGRQAPGVDVDIRPLDVTRHAEDLSTGELDVAISTSFLALKAGLASEVLYTESFVCIARKGHPGVVLDSDGRIDLDSYLALPHALISPTGRGPTVVDSVLERIGRRRRIALRLPYFLAAPLVVARSELVLTAPERVAREFAQTHALDLFQPPVALSGFDVCLLWHVRFAKDPAIAWIREVLTRAAARDPADDPPPAPMSADEPDERR